MDRVGWFVNTYPLDNDRSSGKRYPAFEQLAPGAGDFSSVITLPSVKKAVAFRLCFDVLPDSHN